MSWGDSSIPTRKLMPTIIGLACAAFASPTGAQSALDRSACEPILTVQKRTCVVEHVLLCERNGGQVWWHETIEPGEPVHILIKTLDGDTITDWDEEMGGTQLGVIENRDPFSIEELRRTGTDRADQTIMLNLPMFEPQPAEFSLVSERISDGVTIDGVPLEEFRTTPEIRFNALIISGYEILYVDPATGATFTGETRGSIGGNGIDYPRTPVEIIHPGEQRFMLDRPRYDCGETSLYDQYTRRKET